jgi:hypothetical protein
MSAQIKQMHMTCNPEAYDIPAEGSVLSRHRLMRKALHEHMEQAGYNVIRITAAPGEMQRMADNYPDGLMRFTVHYEHEQEH